MTISNAFTLTDGYKFALENDMNSKINENNIKKIKFDKDIANSLLNPKLDFNATVETSKYTENDLTPNSNKNHTKSDEYKLTLTQPIFDGFESVSEKKLQKYRFESALFYLKESQNNVALNYTQNYINTLKQKDLLSLNKEAVLISEEIFNKVYKKVASGYGTKLEFDEAKSQLAENRVNLKVQKINLKEAIESLRFYVQKDFDTSELIKPNFYYPLPKTLDDAIAASMDKNPSLMVSKLNLKVALFEEQKNDKNFLPNVDLVGSYQVNDALHTTTDENNQYKVGFQINYNLYNGGKDSLERKKALQDIKEKHFLITKSEYEIKNKLRLAWNSYKLNEEKFDTLEQYLLVKKDVLDATIKEFDLGTRDLNNLLTTHTEYVDVKKDFISTTYDLLLAKYRVLDAIGLLSDTLQNKMPTLEKIKLSERSSRNLFEQTDYNFDKSDALNKKKLSYQISEAKLDKVLLPPLKLEDDTLNDKKEDIYVDNDNKEEIEVGKKQEQTIIQKEEKTFKEKFLTASKNKYTINLAMSDSTKRAKWLIQRYNLENDAFYFSFRYENPLQKVMMGIYDTKKEAQKAINSLPDRLKKYGPKIEKVYVKQQLYKKYHTEDYLRIKKQNEYIVEKKPILYKNDIYSNKDIKTNINQIEVLKETKIEEKQEQTIIQKEEKTFKEKFLTASKNKYTINLALSDSTKRAKWLIQRYNLENDAFYFSFRYENPLQKVMMGIYDTKKEAQKAINSLPNRLKRYGPKIEKVSVKQQLYKKYHTEDYLRIKKQEDFLVKKKHYNTKEITKIEKIESKENIISQNKSFKDKFLDAKKDKYTINLAISDSKKRAMWLINKYNLQNKAFSFKIRDEKPLHRIIYGVFDTKDEAYTALNNLDEKLKSNLPIVEKIERKQKLYYKYNSLDTTSERI
jgi:adhesin transport system outer membrane protein